MPREQGPWRKIPANVNPTGTRCIMVDIPDDDEWERAMWDDLKRLQLWNFWARDAAHSGKTLAARWRDALQSWRHCDGSPSPIDDEFEEDMNLCDVLRWHERKLQIMCCGEWQDVPGTDTADGPTGEQPGPHERPGPGDSGCYNLSLNGNGQAIFPFGVSEGDIITITGVDGGWNDGTAAWYCGNGQNYVGGACFGTGHTDGGDPYPAMLHMTLVAEIAGVGAFDVGSSPYTVPAGAAGAQLTFRANDSDLTDNAGSIRFNVCVENGTPPPVGTWCHTWDFTISDGGWSAFVYSGEDQAQYVAGQGWGRTGPIAMADGIFILSPVAASPTTFTRMIIELDSAETTGHSAGKACDKAVTFNIASINADQAVYDLGPFTYADDQICAAFDAYVGTGVATSKAIKRVALYGTGENPFGSNNC